MTSGDVSFTTHGRLLVVTLLGEVDMSNGPELVAAIGTAATNELAGVILDLSDVEYLDSAGIHLVFTLRENLRTRGQDLRLVVPEDSPVSDALRLAGVSGTVPTSAELGSALAELGAQEGASQP
jgi:anti-anti-sigma factor